MRKFSFSLTAVLLSLMFSTIAAPGQPASKSSVPSATFQKIWVDHNFTEAGKRGMRIHTAFKVFAMKGVPSYLQINFQTGDGKPLMDKNGEFDHEDGSVAAFRELKPVYDAETYEDVTVFMPYAELDLPSGKRQLKMDVDVIHEDGRLIQHLTLYDFEYIKP